MREGESQDEIIAEYVKENGQDSIAIPPNQGALRSIWAVPVVGISLGALGLAQMLRRWRRKTSSNVPDAPVATGDAYDKRLDDELKDLDGWAARPLGSAGRRTADVAVAARARQSDDAEDTRPARVAIGLPAVAVVGASVVGSISGVGSGILVLASGALLGTIALLWGSVRTLSGDAPLPQDFEVLMVHRHGVDALAEQKRRVLRALKDVEAEHALGKIDDADYEIFVARYREEAKEVMRAMDLEVAPLREEAERIAREYLAKRGVAAAESEGTGSPWRSGG